MTRFVDDILRSAATSRGTLTTGDPEAPVHRTWAEIHRQAMSIAAGLAFGHGVRPGTSLPILAGGAANLAPLTQAAWLCGAAVTMLQQPVPRTDLSVWLDDTVRAVRLVGTNRVIVGEPFGFAVDELRARGLEVDHVDGLCSGEAPDGAEIFQPHTAAETDIAVRQLTSGSTGSPKAIEISFDNLWHGIDALRVGLNIDAGVDVLISWLPLSHDMGFIGYLALPMQLGARVVIVRPEQFLRNPLLWAQLITKYGGTHTSGPNFAYSVLSRVLERAEAGAFDLSTLHLAGNGAEQISAGDITRFATAGARFGLRQEAMTPGYGLAEATLAVSFTPLSSVPKVDRVKLSSLLSDARAVPASSTDTSDVTDVVSVGTIVEGVEIRIRNSTGRCDHRQVGVIEVRGKAVARNCISEQGTTPLVSDDGWLDTGDLGYLDEDEMLYICGRRKDLIVISGRNLYPTDIERAAADVAGVRTGCVAAVRIPAGTDREGFAVLAESKLYDTPEADVIRSDIVKAVSSQIGSAPREVVVLPPGALPKTPSGKLRRGAAAELLGSAQHAAAAG